jgi:6-phosphofructokinase 1
MDGAFRIFEYLSKENYPCTVIGIPKTVDNDLFVTDHTPGYGSAAKYIALATSAVEFDDLTYQKGRINIIEAMGRDCGYLAASSLLSIPYAGATGPDYIYVPEVPFDVASFLAKAKKTYEKKGRCLIVVSEGIRDYQGRLISSFKKADDFGNIQMGGVSSYLSSLVAKEGYSTRAIELSVLQRSAYFAVSETDVKEARGVSDAALKLALKGQTGVMVTIERKKTKAYGVTYSSCPLSKVAGKAAKMPSKYLAPSGDFIRPSFLSYALPLLG